MHIPKHPVLFAVGLGDPGNIAWRDFALELWPTDDPRFVEGVLWAQVKNESGPPELALQEIDRLLPELQKNFFESFHPDGVANPSDVKLVLYGRSYGAVLVRDYLSKHRSDHHVSGALLEAGPHQGAEITRLAVIPQAMLWGGAGAALASGQFGFGLVSLAGLAIPWVANTFLGLNLEGGGLYALRPDSLYLKNVGQRRLPDDLSYINVVEDCSDIPAVLLNVLELNLGAGDGGISIESQTLSTKVVPNFSELSLRQVKGRVFHWTYPEMSSDTVNPLLLELVN